MKNLLSTTALVAGIAFGGAAFAQTTPVTDASGNPLYTWTDTSGNLVEGTFAEYQTAVVSPVAPDAADATAYPAGTSDSAYITDKATYDSALSAYTISSASLSSLLAGETAPYTSTSLLDNILDDAAALSASISNISQNLNDIDGSISVNTTRNFDDMALTVDELLGDSDAAFGSYSQVNSGIFAQDIPAELLAVLDPLTLTLGDLATTAIGTLQSGNMTGSFDSSGILARVSESADSSSTGVSVLAEQYGSIADTIAMQNVSINSGAINGSVELVLADVNTMAGAISTTAIGALQSGSMGADVTGTMGTVNATTVGLVNALVGTTAP